MATLASVTIILKKNKKNSRGEVPLYIRIIKNRKSRYISIGIKLIPKKHWDEQKQRVKSSYPNSAQANNLILQKLSEANNVALGLATKTNYYSSTQIKEKLIGKVPKDFITFSEKVIIRLEKSGQIRTAKRYRSVINKLIQYQKEKPFYFHDFTVTFLQDYEVHLKSIGNKINSVHSDLKFLRALLYRAIKEDLFLQEKNPFFHFKLKLGKVRKEKLTLDEIISISELEIKPFSRLWDAKNIFLFSFYCGGIRVGDILQLKWSNINNNVLYYLMDKTNKNRKIKLIPQAISILGLYKNGLQKKDDYI